MDMYSVEVIAQMKDLHWDRVIHANTIRRWIKEEGLIPDQTHPTRISKETFRAWWDKNNERLNNKPGRGKSKITECTRCGNRPVIARGLCSKCYARERRKS